MIRPSDRRSQGKTQGRNVRSKNQCSVCPAIHTKSRSWLRSSSTREPSDPPLRVVKNSLFNSVQYNQGFRHVASPCVWFRRAPFGVCSFGVRTRAALQNHSASAREGLSAPEPQQVYLRRKTKPARCLAASAFESGTTVPRLSVLFLFRRAAPSQSAQVR